MWIPEGTDLEAVVLSCERVCDLVHRAVRHPAHLYLLGARTWFCDGYRKPTRTVRLSAEYTECF